MWLRSGRAVQTEATTRKRTKKLRDPPVSARMTNPGKGSSPNQDTRKGFGIRTIFTKPKETQGSPALQTRKKKEEAPPPIFLPFDRNKLENETLLADKVRTALKHVLKPDEFCIRNLFYGTQIRTASEDNLIKAESALLKAKLEFYTPKYDSGAKTKKKFVLYDLGDMDIPNIIDDMNAYGLNPLEVKKMTIKTPRYKGQSNYLIIFDADDGITLPIVTQAKYICNTSVRWAYYKQAQNKIQQCNNCFRFGHTSTGCKLKVVCFLCANHHKAENCPLMEKKQKSGAKSIPQNLLKCTNCTMKEGLDDKHTAIFQDCPSRVMYQTKPRNHENKRSNIRRPAAYSPAPLPQTPVWKIDETIPPTTPRAKRVIIQTHSSSKVPPPIQASRQGAFIDQHRTPKQKQRQVQPNMNQVSNNSGNNIKSTTSLLTHITKRKLTSDNQQTKTNDNIDSFTTQEMTEIFREMVSSISNCSNKEEQLSALLEIALKYTPCRG